MIEKSIGLEQRVHRIHALLKAGKYCNYFITHDDRILKRSDGLGELLPPSLTVVTLAEFFEILDNYPER